MALGNKKTAQQLALESAKFEAPANMSSAAKAFRKSLHKKYGTDPKAVRPRDYVKSSSLKFNHILGGGWLRGRVFEMFGPESGGKTTWALDAIANAQRQYPKQGVFFIDVERTLELDRAAKLGVDIDSMGDPHIPENGDTAMDDLYDACMSGAFSTVVLDSVAGLETSEEVVASVGQAKNKVGQSGRLMSVGMKKIIRAAYSSNTLVIFINQMRDVPGVLVGPKETTPGGRALKFYASARISVKQRSEKERSPKFLGPGKEVIGHQMEMQVVKNKLGAPWRKATIDLYYASPLDTVSELLELGIQNGILQNVGNKREQDYQFEGKIIASGEDGLRKILMENHSLRLKVMEAIEKTYVKTETATLSETEEIDVLLKEDSEESDKPTNTSVL
jgi:recombination protein RecA